MILDSWTLEAYLNSSWVDISADVHGSITADWGIRQTSLLDRVASTGRMEFELLNTGNEYSPGHASCTAGWGFNVPIRLTLTYSAANYYYRYYVNKIEVLPGIYGRRTVLVKCVDWIDYAAKLPLLFESITADQTADQALTSIVSALPIAPQETSYSVGTETFPYVFDSVTKDTRALSEIKKVVMSELGYLYLQKNGSTDGEKLVLENSIDRSGIDSLTVYNTSDTFIADNTMFDADIEYGENIINQIELRTHTKTLGTTTDEQLYDPSPGPNTIEDPFIASGENLIFSGYYNDAITGMGVNAFTLDAASSNNVLGITTDYLTDFTSDLTYSRTDYAAGFTWDVTNNSVYSGWFSFAIIGQSIRDSSNRVYRETSSDSQNSHGTIAEVLDQFYKADTAAGKKFVKTVVGLEKDPEARIKKVRFHASSDALMLGFLSLDIGDVVEIIEDQSGIDAYYYINAIEFELMEGGYIDFEWTLRVLHSVYKGLSPLALEFTGTSSDSVGFGNIPRLENITKKSVSSWVYPTTDDDAHTGVIFANYNSYSGFLIAKTTTDTFEYYQRHAITSDDGVWNTSDGSLGNNAWYHLVMTIDLSTSVATPPKMYINNVAMVLTTDNPASGAVKGEKGNEITIGNVPILGDYSQYAFDGKITNVREYINYILTTDDITSLYNAGQADTVTLLTSDLAFWGPFVKTGDLNDYIDTVLSSGMNVLDAVNYAIGKPHDTPTGRTTT